MKYATGQKVSKGSLLSLIGISTVTYLNLRRRRLKLPIAEAVYVWPNMAFCCNLQKQNFVTVGLRPCL